MTTIILTAICAVIFWQLVVAIVCIATNEDEEIVMRTALGVWGLVFLIIGKIYRKIHLEMSRKYNTYQFYGDTDKSTSASKADKWINNFVMTEKVASQFRQVGKNETPVPYSIRLLTSGKDFKFSPCESNILTQEKINNGFRGFSKDFLKKFMKGD